jgi:hypothetical protein
LGHLIRGLETNTRDVFRQAFDKEREADINDPIALSGCKPAGAARGAALDITPS